MTDTSMQQIIQDQLDILPDDVREVVESQEWRKTVYDLGRKYALKIDELGQLEQEVYYTMIGLVPSSEFVGNLVNRVHLTRDVAGSLSQEINSNVFEKIREFIMDMDGHEAAEMAEDAAGSRAPAAEARDGHAQVPSREDLLKEIEEIGEGNNVPPPAPPVAYSPIETSLTKPMVTTPVDLDKELSKPSATPAPAAPAAATAPIPAAATAPAAVPNPPPQAPAPSNPADPYRELPQ